MRQRSLRVLWCLAVLSLSAAPVQEEHPAVTAADRVIRAAMAPERVPGVGLAIVHDGKIVTARGYGVADVATSRPATADTVFRIGSISKVITALAVVQLVDQKRLGFDEDVNEHLTQFKIEDRFDEPVRVWHLLTHTAGFDQRFMAREGARATDQFSLATFLEQNLVRIRPPGRAASYDTYGITLAGHLVEQISRMPYDVYLRKKLFEPLGMSRTNVGAPLPGLRAETAVGYRLANDVLTPQLWEHYRSSPASSINSSASDMGRFMLAVLNEGATAAGRIWSDGIGRRIQREQQFQNGPSGGFSFGFWDEVRNGRRTIFHGGNMNGYETHMVLVPDLEFGMFVAYNREGRPFPSLRDPLSRTVLDVVAPPPAVQPAAVQAVQVPLDRFAGTYADATYCHTCYENESEGNMTAFPIEIDPRGVLRFSGTTWIPVAPLQFAEEGGPRRLRFRETASGEITSFAVAHRTHEKLGERLIDEVLGPRRLHVLPGPFEARVYRLTNDPLRAAAAYRKLIAVRPWDGVLHHYLGVVLLAAKQPAQAAEAFVRAAECDQWPIPTNYLLATAYARSNQTDAAFGALERAVDVGFVDAGRLERDQAFESVRSHERYRAILQRITPRERE